MPSLLRDPVESFLSKLAGLDTFEPAWRVFERAMASLGFDRALYVSSRIADDSGVCEECAHNLPASFVAAIADEACETDPLALASARQLAPFTFEGLGADPIWGPRCHGILRQARAHGLHGGLTIPIRAGLGRLAYFALHSSASAAAFNDSLRAHQSSVHLMALYFHAHAHPLRPPPAQTKPEGLTRRERECLRWTATGKTAWETSVILGVSERTVHFHVQNAMRKLDASTKTMAVARGLALGLLQP